VAVVTTAAIAVVYLACVTVLNLVISAHLSAEGDARLTARLADLSRQPAQLAQLGQQVTSPRSGSDSGSGSDDSDDNAPVLTWLLGPGGRTVARTPGAPALPAVVTDAARGGQPGVVTLGQSGAFRLQTARTGPGVLVAGLSLAPEDRFERWLLTGEAIVGPVLLLAMFAGSLLIGLRAQAPVEQARRRQLEFTTDASHSLRTPLSVIRAETDLALATPRDADDYRDTLSRIRGETDRLRRLVEDMLWLARFDSQVPAQARPPPRGRGATGGLSTLWAVVSPLSPWHYASHAAGQEKHCTGKYQKTAFRPRRPPASSDRSQSLGCAPAGPRATSGLPP
jgi:signal transduction histidine kinase